MSTLTTAAMSSNLLPQLKAYVNMNYKMLPRICDKFVNTVSTEHAYERFAGFEGFGAYELMTEGGRHKMDSVREVGSKVVHVADYTKGIEITDNAIQDSKAVVDFEALVNEKSMEFAKSLNYTEEVLGHDLLNNAFSSVTTIDGVALISASHTSPIGNVSNLASGDISELALENAITAIRKFTDPTGRPINAMPDKLIIPEESRYAVSRILDSKLQTGTTDNNVNALRAEGMRDKIEVVPSIYLTDTNSWFITTDYNDAKNGLAKLSRQELKFRSDNDIMTWNKIITSKVRFAHFALDHRAIYGSAGT